MTKKLCPKCGESKSLELFSKSASNKNGMQVYCKACVSLYKKQYYTRNRERLKEKSNRYYHAHFEECKVRRSNHYRRTLSETKKRKQKWARNNKGLCNSRNARRRALKLKATPSWLNEEDLEQIKWIYNIAQILNKYLELELHVDHIVPLKGKDICGLHVPWNLQIIPAIDNISKGNKYVPT